MTRRSPRGNPWLLVGDRWPDPQVGHVAYDLILQGDADAAARLCGVRPRTNEARQLLWAITRRCRTPSVRRPLVELGRWLHGDGELQLALRHGGQGIVRVQSDIGTIAMAFPWSGGDPAPAGSLAYLTQAGHVTTSLSPMTTQYPIGVVIDVKPCAFPPMDLLVAAQANVAHRLREAGLAMQARPSAKRRKKYAWLVRWDGWIAQMFTIMERQS